MATPMEDAEVQRALLGVRNSAIPEPVADVAGTAAMLGVPDPTGGKAPPLSLEQIRAASEAAPPVGGSVNLNSGTAPAYVPPTIVGQKPAPAAAPGATPPMGDNTVEPLPAQPELRQTETRTQVTGGTKVDPKIEAERQAAVAAQAGTVARSTEIEAQAQAKIADIEQQKAMHLADEHRRREEEKKQEAAYVDEQMQRIRTAQTELDQNRKAPEETTGQSVVRGIALALGVVGRALGGNIDVNEIVTKDKATKLSAWQAQYERMKGNVAGEQNIYALLRQRGLDKEQAAAATEQRLNDDYASVIKTIVAESAAPLTREKGMQTLAKLQAENAALAQRLYGDAQAKWTQVKDDKTKQGLDGGDVKTLEDRAQNNPDIKAYRASRMALDRFQALRASGADGAAIASFIAGKGGLEQGSFGPNFVEFLKKRSWFGQKAEDIRRAFGGGEDPALLREIGNAIALDAKGAGDRAMPAVKSFTQQYRAAGLDPRTILGGETSTEAAAGVGFEPEGKK